MTSDVVPADGDARRLLDDARGLARRVRVAQRVTWLPLLALGVVMFGAILVYRFTDPIVSDCRPDPLGGQVCRAWFLSAQIYWWVGLVLAYVVIAAGYLRVARDRGLGTRVRPYVVTGIALVVASALVGFAWQLLDYPYFPDTPPPLVTFLIRLVDASGATGLALLVLAWLERHVALAVFALGYLVVALVPINFGWGENWGSNWGMGPQLVINGGLLLLGSAGFALAQRWRRPR
ncbi:hypothetical protein [Paractinoplanes maris]|uniref:hypothetical protein n=1 Tax=Paractinoplanes maris TaxID=1734446 RepID=UPI00202049D9|nr:hypothetical protein [Actinoplanes maris]